MAAGMKKRIFQVAAVCFGLAALSVLLLLWKPPCLILRFTGLYCPGCGGQRMMDAILHGDFLSAFRRNSFLFCLFPLLLFYLTWEAVRYVRGKSPLYKRKPALFAGGIVLISALVFMILRNLPAFAFLAP